MQPSSRRGRSPSPDTRPVTVPGDDACPTVSLVVATPSLLQASSVQSQFMSNYSALAGDPSPVPAPDVPTVYPIHPYHSAIMAIQPNHPLSETTPNAVSLPFGTISSASGVDPPMSNPQNPASSSVSNANPGLFLPSVGDDTSQWDRTTVATSTHNRLGQGAQSDLRWNTSSRLGHPLRSNHDASGRTLRCEWKDCSYRNPFRRKGDLLRHIKDLHVSPRSFVCPFAGCRRAFNRNDNLQQHVLRCHRVG